MTCPALSHGSLHHHDQLCSGIWRRELMFYLEWSSPNEPQAEVRNGASIALPSDYRSKTYLRALTYQVVCSGVYVPPYLTILWGNITTLHHKDTRSERAASVMSGKSKSERPQHCAQKGQKWGSKEGWWRENEMLVQMSSDCLQTSDTLFPRLTLVLQLVLFLTLHCLPWCLLWHTQATCLCMPEQRVHSIHHPIYASPD